MTPFVSRVRPRSMVPWLLATWLPGCGGEGATSVQNLDAETYCAPTQDWPAAATEKEYETLDLVNERRSEGATCGSDSYPPAPPLDMLGSLQCAARRHSADMLERAYFDHTSPDGVGPKERMEVAGFEGRSWGENIAAGSATAEGAMNQWMSSSGHCRNIMSSNYRYLGVGYVEGGERRHLWTQKFGR